MFHFRGRRSCVHHARQCKTSFLSRRRSDVGSTQQLWTRSRRAVVMLHVAGRLCLHVTEFQGQRCRLLPRTGLVCQIQSDQHHYRSYCKLFVWETTGGASKKLFSAVIGRARQSDIILLEMARTINLVSRFCIHFQAGVVTFDESLCLCL